MDTISVLPIGPIPRVTTMTAIVASTIHPETAAVATTDPLPNATMMANTASMMPTDLANAAWGIPTGHDQVTNITTNPTGIVPATPHPSALAPRYATHMAHIA
jgi:hypothetical protein